MSAFVVVFELSASNMLGLPGVFDKAMSRLAHRGPDGSNTVSAHNTHMGYWHFQTLPEETGERQPLKLDNLPFRIVFDGRIDNRNELFAMLNIPAAETKHLSDAALTLRSYDRWGEDCFQKLVGEFALVIFDEVQQEIVAARDHLGDRTLFYGFPGKQLVIASEPWAVAGAFFSRPEINENAAVHYFAGQIPQDGQTFFKNVFELLPAHILRSNRAGHRLWRYWVPDPYKQTRYKTDDEYAGHFRALLEESVRSRMRCSHPVGVLMSGGLDSTSVACLAARMKAPQPLTTISYVFDELPESDERKYIAPVTEKYGMDSIQIPCDDLWTFKDWEGWPWNPNQPNGNPYRMIIERVHKRANQEGLRILLTGYMGDQLYSAAGDWVADLIMDGRLLEAGRELIYQVRNRGWKRTAKTGHLRRIARRAADSIHPGLIRLPHSIHAPEWIKPAFAELFANYTPFNRVFDRHGSLLGLEVSSGLSSSFQSTSRNQMELRNPYRDRRLIEFILAIPAYQLYSKGIFRPVLRMAMRDILPEEVRTRYTKSGLVPLHRQGIEREKNLLESYMSDPNGEWRKFLHEDWISKVLACTYSDSIDGLLLFFCVSYTSWYQSFVSKN